MTLRALVVDDEPVARRKLRMLLEGEPSVQVVGECEDGGAAVDAIREQRPDVVFLDIQMPGLDGFDVVEALEPDEQPAIVFVTAYDRYAVRAFEIHAVDYLLKPFERARLRKTIERLVSRTNGRDAGRRVQAAVETVRRHQPLRRVLVKAAGRIYAVRVEDVEAIEAAGHYLEVRTSSAAHLIRESIGTLAQRLDASRFVRIHRSTIVNVDRIRDLQPAFHGEFVVTLHSGRRLRCSRTYAAGLTEALGR
ncbi:MAG TPA: response regulator [Vicinamibacterales bacterium]|nr:response regulator [Vicinamibacterales bacterium]